MDSGLRKGWKVCKLGEVCEIKTGKKDVNEGNPNGLYPFFTCAKEHTYIDNYSFDLEALLIAGNGNVGAVNYYNGKFDAYQRTYILYNFKNILPKLLFILLDGTLKQIMFKQKLGNTIPYIKLGMLKNFTIQIPPLQEQEKIVVILDEAFSAIAKAKANAELNLQNAKELFESYLQSVFENRGEDWEEKTLSDTCEITSKLIDPKESKYQNLIHIGAGNIEAQKGTLVDLKTAKEENLISGKFLFDETMVLYSKIRPYLMKVVRCELKGLCSADIYPLVPDKNIMTKDFLYHLLLSNHFTEYAIKGSQRAGMPKVNRKYLFEYTFYCPPIQEQKQIVKKLNTLQEQTKKLESIYTQKLQDLDELKKSILQKAFNGELT